MVDRAHCSSVSTMYITYFAFAGKIIGSEYLCYRLTSVYRTKSRIGANSHFYNILWSFEMRFGKIFVNLFHCFSPHGLRKVMFRSFRGKVDIVVKSCPCGSGIVICKACEPHINVFGSCTGFSGDISFTKV